VTEEYQHAHSLKNIISATGRRGQEAVSCALVERECGRVKSAL
jgi:hypothetical protein